MTVNPKRGGTVSGRDPRDSNLEKDPEDWVSGDDPMTGAQASSLQTLCEEAGRSASMRCVRKPASRAASEARTGVTWTSDG
jgi:hypothetical protein